MEVKKKKKNPFRQLRKQFICETYYCWDSMLLVVCNIAKTQISTVKIEISQVRTKDKGSGEKKKKPNIHQVNTKKWKDEQKQIIQLLITTCCED